MSLPFLLTSSVYGCYQTLFRAAWILYFLSRSIFTLHLQKPAVCILVPEYFYLQINRSFCLHHLLVNLNLQVISGPFVFTFTSPIQEFISKAVRTGLLPLFFLFRYSALTYVLVSHTSFISCFQKHANSISSQSFSRSLGFL